MNRASACACRHSGSSDSLLVDGGGPSSQSVGVDGAGDEGVGAGYVTSGNALNTDDTSDGIGIEGAAGRGTSHTDGQWGAHVKERPKTDCCVARVGGDRSTAATLLDAGWLPHLSPVAGRLRMAHTQQEVVDEVVKAASQRD